MDGLKYAVARTLIMLTTLISFNAFAEQALNQALQNEQCGKDLKTITTNIRNNVDSAKHSVKGHKCVPLVGKSCLPVPMGNLITGSALYNRPCAPNVCTAIANTYGYYARFAWEPGKPQITKIVSKVCKF